MPRFVPTVNGQGPEALEPRIAPTAAPYLFSDPTLPQPPAEPPASPDPDPEPSPGTFPGVDPPIVEPPPPLGGPVGPA